MEELPRGDLFPGGHRGVAVERGDEWTHVEALKVRPHGFGGGCAQEVVEDGLFTPFLTRLELNLPA